MTLCVHIWHNGCLWCVIRTYVSDHRHELGYKSQGQLYVNSVRIWRTPFSFFLQMVFIFSTLIACGVQITMKFTDHCYALDVNGQVQTY